MCMQDGNCPLYIARNKGHDKTVEILLQAGATVDLQDKVDSYYLLLWENGVHSNLSNFDGTSYILWKEDFFIHVSMLSWLNT